MATDFRNGLFPRRGREDYHGFLWLLRVFDKGRASHQGTIHDYIYPCGMDKGVFQRWGITPQEFDAALATATADEHIHAWVRGRVSDAGREAANRWLLEEKVENLDNQDAEEGAVAAR